MFPRRPQCCSGKINLQESQRGSFPVNQGFICPGPTWSCLISQPLLRYLLFAAIEVEACVIEKVNRFIQHRSGCICEWSLYVLFSRIQQITCLAVLRLLSFWHTRNPGIHCYNPSIFGMIAATPSVAGRFKADVSTTPTMLLRINKPAIISAGVAPCQPGVYLSGANMELSDFSAASAIPSICCR